MDPRIADGMRERSRRPVRNKRYNRRTYAEEKRPPKRLFTPEIKRFLKDWLVRRRDNPYPNRDEKKSLAIQTGLTYIQVCNWFANWRRKLKNSGKEPQKKSWGYLIKTYNSQVHGNVEHFSICSEDSIWQEADINGPPSSSPGARKYDVNNLVSDMSGVNVSPFYEQRSSAFFSGYKSDAMRYSCVPHEANGSCISQINNNNNNNNNSIMLQSQYFVPSSLEEKEDSNPFSQNVNKYKNHIMEKYLRDCQKPENYTNEASRVEGEEATKPSMISKWLESAANFRPSENNYLNWTLAKSQKKKCKKSARADENSALQHGKEELDAAEALTRLANAHASLKLCNPLGKSA